MYNIKLNHLNSVLHGLNSSFSVSLAFRAMMGYAGTLPFRAAGSQKDHSGVVMGYPKMAQIYTSTYILMRITFAATFCEGSRI